MATGTENAEELRNLFESSRLAAAFLDGSLRLRSFSPEFARVFGLRDRDRWKIIWEAIPEIDPQRGWSERLTSAMQAGIRCEAALDVPRLGQTYLLAITGYRTNAGALEGAVISLSDVTEIKRARRDHSQLASLVHVSREAIVGLDVEGNVLSWNPAAERMFGWSGEEILGRDVSVLVPDDKAAESDELLLRLRRGDRPEPVRTVRRCKDGKAVSLSILFAPVNGLGGKLEGVSMIAREVSDELEAKLYTIAHDLRGPLRSIGAFAELLLAEHGAKLEPSAQDYAQRIVRGAQKMDQLLTALVHK